MKPRSLRARMLALSAVAAVLALVIAAWSIAGILTRFVTEGLDQRLDAQIAVMASAVRDDGTIDRDQMVMVEVMVDELDAEWWAAYRVQLERRFQQDAIVARALSISPL